MKTLKAIFKIMLALILIRHKTHCKEYGVFVPCKKHNNMYDKLDDEIGRSHFTSLFTWNR